MDKELIARVKSGESEAFELVLRESTPLIKRIISNQINDYGDYALDKEEMYQLSSIALYEACLRYDEKRGMSFSSFAYMVIKSKLINYYKNCAKVYSYEYYSIDAEHNGLLNHVGVVKDSAYTYHRQQEVEQKLDEFLDSLSLEDRQIIEYKRKDMPYKEISERLNISVKRVSNRLQIMKKKFSKYQSK